MQTVYSGLDNHQLGVWVNIFWYMLEEDEGNRLNFTQLLGLEVCSICYSTLKIRPNNCPNCVCSQCGQREKTDFCSKGLCSLCLNSGSYCLGCEHFIFLPKVNLSNEPEAIEISCLCGLDWELTETNLLCDCGVYCKICKLRSHILPCYKTVQTRQIMCVCRSVATRCPDTFYFTCEACNKEYCIVCLKPVVDVSHLNCTQQLMKN